MNKRKRYRGFLLLKGLVFYFFMAFRGVKEKAFEGQGFFKVRKGRGELAFCQ